MNAKKVWRSAEKAFAAMLLRLGCSAGNDENEATLLSNQFRIELELILEALEVAPWRDRGGEKAKRIWFAPAAIDRLRRLLST